MAVVEHYDKLFGLKLTAAQKADLVEYPEVALDQNSLAFVSVNSQPPTPNSQEVL